MMNMNNLIDETNQPVAASFALTFIQKSEEKTRQAAQARGRTYRNISSANRSGMARKHLVPGINSAIREGLYAAASADLSNSENRLRDEAFQQACRTYLSAA